MRIVLASESPRRKELLKELSIRFETFHSQIDESVLPNEAPMGYAMRLARTKAHTAAQELGDGLYIGADTVVALDGAIFGKPKDIEDAKDILSCLSGKTHTVITAYCVFDNPSGKEELKAVETLVTIKELTETEIEEYVATLEPMDKAGAYAIQGKGNFMVEKIVGSYSNVVGLPTTELRETLKAMLPTSKS